MILQRVMTKVIDLQALKETSSCQETFFNHPTFLQLSFTKCITQVF